MNKYEKEAKPCPFCGEKIVDLQVYSFSWFFKGVIKCLIARDKQRVTKCVQYQKPKNGQLWHGTGEQNDHR